MADTIRHLYVHVPFCDGKCVYCAFYSERHTAGAAAAYLAALAREFDRHLERRGRLAPRTIYLGGGTPAVLPARQLAALLGLLRSRCDLSRLREWTMEGNPGAFTREKLQAMRDAGVNRVSLGVQSFEDAVLRRIGRRHGAKDIARTVDLLRAAGVENIGLDLIASLPGVGDARWRRALARTIELQPKHVSIYSLTVEPGSRLHARVQAGRMAVPGDARQLRALAAAESALGAAGYERYEISNYALPGSQCRHNLACWQGEDYVGFGPAAASRAGRTRWTNRPDLAAYVTTLLAGGDPPRERETLRKWDDVIERLVFAFRLREGLDLNSFAHRYSVPAAWRKPWERTLSRLADGGLVRRNGARWALDGRGRNLADAVAAELMG